jgi:hypothetical protein
MSRGPLSRLHQLAHQFPTTNKMVGTSEYGIRQLGAANTLGEPFPLYRAQRRLRPLRADYRVFLENKNGQVISPFHDMCVRGPGLCFEGLKRVKKPVDGR